MLDQLGTIAGALSRAVLDLPIGELEAAVENRPPTGADRNRTVRSVTGMSERELEAAADRQLVARGLGQVLAGLLRRLHVPVSIERLRRLEQRPPAQPGPAPLLATFSLN